MKSKRAVQSPPYLSPGLRNRRPCPLRSAALVSSWSKFPWKRRSTSTVRVMAPPMSSTAFTIWIQVVARMPPKDT